METSTFDPAVTVSEVSDGISLSVVVRLVEMIVTSSVSFDAVVVLVVSGRLVMTVVGDVECDVDDDVGAIIFNLPDDVTDVVTDDVVDIAVDVADVADVADDVIDAEAAVEVSNAVDDVEANSINVVEDLDAFVIDGVGDVVGRFMPPGFGHTSAILQHET